MLPVVGLRIRLFLSFDQHHSPIDFCIAGISPMSFTESHLHLCSCFSVNQCAIHHSRWPLHRTPSRTMSDLVGLQESQVLFLRQLRASRTQERPLSPVWTFPNFNGACIQLDWLHCCGSYHVGVHPHIGSGVPWQNLAEASRKGAEGLPMQSAPVAFPSSAEGLQ